MSPQNLESLTNELFEQIVGSLSLDDIKNLRLVNRSTAYKTTQDTFRSFFRRKAVDLRAQNLENLVHATSENRLGTLVEDLCLVGIVYNTLALQNIVKKGEKYVRDQNQPSQIPCDDQKVQQAAHDLDILRRRQSEDQELRASRTDVALLTEAFTNLAASKSTPGLKTLSLQIAVYKDNSSTKTPPREAGCWKWNFEAASRTFMLAMTCLCESRLSLQTLDAFAKSPESLGCNIPCDILRYIKFDAVPTLTTIKNLSIGISDLIINWSEYDLQDSGDKEQSLPRALRDQKLELEHLQAQITEDDNYSGLARMIEACPNLEELDVSGYRIPCSHRKSVALWRQMRRRLLYHIARIESLHRLQKLRLAGFSSIDSADLVVLLTHHSASLRHLELNNIYVTQGLWEPVVAYLPNMCLNTVHLEDLWEVSGGSSKLMHFAGEFEQEYILISGDHARRNVIKCWGPGGREKISCHRYEGMAIGSPRVWGWNQRRREEFGGR